MSRDQRPGTKDRIYRRASISALGLLLLAVVSCDRPSGPPAAQVPIFFTCDTRGRLEPCGCFTGQYGGLTRLKTVLDAEPPGPSVRVDVGDSIGGREDYDLLQYGYMLKAFAALKFDALNVGHREARLTAAQLRQLKLSSPVPILSANLLDKSTGRPIFEPFRIIERAGFRIGIIGVVDPQGLGEDLGEGLQIAGMESALASHLAKLKAKTDLIILLAFANEATLARLARQFYEIHVILGGKVLQPAQELKRENRSLIYFVTNESRALGILRLQLSRNRPLRVVKNEILLLHDRIPQDPSFVGLAQAYRQEVRRTPLAVDDPANTTADMVPGVRAVAAYVGSERCIECHTQAGALWTQSAHARAFAPLLERHADADPKCVGCHTIGFGTASGFRRNPGTGHFRNVGCESCHGPGSLHVRQREGDETVSFAYRPLAAGDCQKCHYGEFSRPFRWDEFWPVIKHGLEVSTERSGG